MAALHMRHHRLDALTDDPRAAAAASATAGASAAPADNPAAMALLAKMGGSGGAAAQASSPGAADGAAAAAERKLGTYLPLVDVSTLRDNLQVNGESPAPEQPNYQPQHMDKISCWAALQPPHIEVSTALMTGIKLFPPTEAAYPTFVDFDAAQRKLSMHVSTKRLRLGRRLLRKQDKYQLKTWEHSPGEA